MHVECVSNIDKQFKPYDIIERNLYGGLPSLAKGFVPAKSLALSSMFLYVAVPDDYNSNSNSRLCDPRYSHFPNLQSAAPLTILLDR